MNTEFMIQPDFLKRSFHIDTLGKRVYYKDTKNGIMLSALKHYAISVSWSVRGNPVPSLTSGGPALYSINYDSHGSTLRGREAFIIGAQDTTSPVRSHDVMSILLCHQVTGILLIWQLLSLTPWLKNIMRSCLEADFTKQHNMPNKATTPSVTVTAANTTMGVFLIAIKNIQVYLCGCKVHNKAFSIKITITFELECNCVLYTTQLSLSVLHWCYPWNNSIPS